MLSDAFKEYHKKNPQIVLILVVMEDALWLIIDHQSFNFYVS